MAHTDTGRVQGLRETILIAKWEGDYDEESGLDPETFFGRPPDEVYEATRWSSLEGELITDPTMIDRLEAQVAADEQGGLEHGGQGTGQASQSSA